MTKKEENQENLNINYKLKFKIKYTKIQHRASPRRKPYKYVVPTVTLHNITIDPITKELFKFI